VHVKRAKHALRKMTDIGVRVKRQAFAMDGLNDVIEKHLPTKVRSPKKSLP